MFDDYLIGLRDGLEAAVAACLLLALVVRTGRRDALPPVRAGIGVAVVLALGFGWALTFGSQQLTPRAQETLGGTLSAVAVALVMWTVLGTRRMAARHVRTLLAATAFFAVGRESLDTSLFLWASVRASLDGSHGPLLVVLLGLFTALVLALLLHLAAIRVDVTRFLTWSGVVLLVVAAGFLAQGVHALQEAELLGGPRDTAFDVSGVVPPDSWYGALLAGVLGFRPDPTVLQVAVWLLYTVPALAAVPVSAALSRTRPPGSNSRAYDRRSPVDRHL
ncbi:FTR1 family protein [Streptomyces sp. NPDC093510]|uniref:FTR1 family iron permease n=1 Tax=Streptomyces sp. NPDC093510 TaxID=3155199 RepID=UPI00342611BB